MKRILSLIIVVFIIAMFGCSAAGVEIGLTGTWDLTDFTVGDDAGYEVKDASGTLTINSDDTYSMTTESTIKMQTGDVEYKTEEEGTIAGDYDAKTLTATIDKYKLNGDETDPPESKVVYTYAVEGSTLTLTDEDDTVMTFTKK